MSLEDEIRKDLWDAVDRTEGALFAHLAGDEGGEVTFGVLLESLTAKLGALETAVLRIARKLDDMDTGRIALLAQYAVGKAICLAGESPEDAAPKLTRRERDVLMWTCEGKTDWEIGAILGISEHSADKHLRGLKAKLKATSKPQLVARAFRLGLV